ncbi:hypothetical protein [Streptomyces sp. TR06-5]|uniref:hypothetical protein n=1 Tax=Streptomyces sp. TR06-5 TaxID=3385976 RepID=UPI0039A20465
MRAARTTAAALILTVAGCTTSGAPDNKASAPTRAPSEAERTAASDTTVTEPTATPSFAQDGPTRVLTYGNLEVRATPGAEGVRGTVAVTNRSSKKATYQLKVSIGNGSDWVAHKNFWFQDVPPGGASEQSALFGTTHRDALPDRPSILIDRFERIGLR